MPDTPSVVRARLAAAERAASRVGPSGEVPDSAAVDAALLDAAVGLLGEFGVVPSASQRNTLGWLCRDGPDTIADVLELVESAHRGS